METRVCRDAGGQFFRVFKAPDGSWNVEQLAHGVHTVRPGQIWRPLNVVPPEGINKLFKLCAE